MKECSEERHRVYVIFRVYNLGTDAVNFNIYLDPWRLERDKLLSITAREYSVVPYASGVSTELAIRSRE
jgi:hypothetical protein